MGAAFVCGLHEGGVLSCGKHFPGHGDTDTDSHIALPVVGRDRAALESTELVPFRTAIAAGVPALMTAHVLYPALDPDWPATLSARVLRGLLRGELAFGGVVVSDDLDMRAISASHDSGSAAVQTLAAGADLLLFCSDLEKAECGAAAIERAVIDGRLAFQTVDAAARRVGAMQRLAPAARSAPSDLPIAEHVALLERLAAARQKET
jgi:beta-N-acetylhexosaminidase